MVEKANDFNLNKENYEVISESNIDNEESPASKVTYADVMWYNQSKIYNHTLEHKYSQFLIFIRKSISNSI